jgi:hypothetical protein
MYHDLCNNMLIFHFLENLYTELYRFQQVVSESDVTNRSDQILNSLSHVS